MQPSTISINYRVYKQTKQATSRVACFLLPHIVAVVVVVASFGGSKIPTRVCLPNENNNQNRGRRSSSSSRIREEEPAEKRPHFTYINTRTCFLSFLSWFYFFAPLSFNFSKSQRTAVVIHGGAPTHLPRNPTPAAATPPWSRPILTHSCSYLCQRTCSAAAPSACVPPPSSFIFSSSSSYTLPLPPTMLFVLSYVLFSCVFVHLR